MWEIAQDKYYCIVKENRRTGLTSTAWLIKKLYDTSKSQWNHRNEILHRETERNTSKREIAQLRSEIKKRI